MQTKVEGAVENDGASSVGNTGPIKKKRGTPENLKPRWQPGQSGNPSGRPQMSPEVKAALAGAALPAIQKQIELLGCGDVRVELMASQALLDRFYGKAVQAVEANVTTTNVQQAHLQILVELQAKRDQAMKTIEGDVSSNLAGVRLHDEGDTQMVEEYDPSNAKE